MPHQEKEHKFIDISPHRSIMTKISQTGYSIQEAISELIDNALDARFLDKKLKVNIVLSAKEILIEDNGRGMTEDQAVKSIRLGFSEKRGQLGEFGLGLKTSTSFLGKAFRLETSNPDSDEEYQLEYDETDWLKNGDWFKYPFSVQSPKSRASGTLIKITDLKIDISEKLLKNIREEFNIRFGPFIKNDELELVFNGGVCEPYKEKLIEDEKTDFSFESNGVKAGGWWGYKLTGPNKSYYGFQAYRRGRLIATHDKIGLTPNQDVRQIVGEIHIEGVPITHDKKGWLKSSVEYQDLERWLREYFKPFEKKPKRVLSGFPASAGRVIGTVRLVNMFMSGDMKNEMERIKKGDIIVTAMTRPHFLLGIRRAAGIITDMGGSLCHAAIVAREFDIPAVVGTQIATSILQDGQKVILDGNDGYVYEV